MARVGRGRDAGAALAGTHHPVTYFRVAWLQIRTLHGSYPSGAGTPIVSGGGPTVLLTGHATDAVSLTFASTIGHTPATEWTIGASSLLATYTLLSYPTLR